MTSRLNEEQIGAGLKMATGWEQRGNAIVRDYRFPGFSEAIAFVNRVARLAESADHHPDILIRYDKVSLTLSTHSSGGVTQKDFDLARTIDAGESA